MAISDGIGENAISAEIITREEAINQAIHAVAAGDAELGRMLDAQSERLRYVVGSLSGSGGQALEIDQALQTNESVRHTLQMIMNMQMISNQKLSELLGE